MSVNTRRIVLGAMTAVAVVVGLWLIAAGPASDRSVSNLGTDRFDSLRPQNVARDAAEGPIYFRDPLNEGRDIYLTHDGGDIDAGFRAFSALNADTGCLLQYDPDANDLFDVCDGSRKSVDFAGQLEYPITIRDDRLVIDLNFQERSTTTAVTTTAPSEGDS